MTDDVQRVNIVIEGLRIDQAVRFANYPCRQSGDSIIYNVPLALNPDQPRCTFDAVRRSRTGGYSITLDVKEITLDELMKALERAKSE